MSEPKKPREFYAIEFKWKNGDTNYTQVTHEHPDKIIFREVMSSETFDELARVKKALEMAKDTLRGLATREYFRILIKQLEAIEKGD